MGFIRSTFFLAFMWASIPFATALFLILYPVPYRYRAKIISLWSKVCLSVLTFFCGLKFDISGLENTPDKPCIIFCKHQSTWETMVLQLYFIPEVWILKRELLWVPFFGWTLASMKSIAIDRSSGKKALKQLVEQGKKRLNEGYWVIVFPEGTRKLPGAKPDYKIGGAMLAAQSGYDVLPIAHNAGEFWPKGQYVKKAGTIKMVVGPIIKTKDLKAKQINQQAEQWIETTMSTIYEKDYE